MSYGFIYWKCDCGKLFKEGEDLTLDTPEFEWKCSCGVGNNADYTFHSKECKDSLDKSHDKSRNKIKEVFEKHLKTCPKPQICRKCYKLIGYDDYGSIEHKDCKERERERERQFWDTPIN